MTESAARSHPGAGGEKEKEEKEKEGRSGSEKGLDPSGPVRLLPSGEHGLDQRGPVRLPQDRELGLDQTDPVRLRHKGRDGEPEEVPSCGSQRPASSVVRPHFLPQENLEESSSELTEESSQDELGNQIVNELERIAQEEPVWRWDGQESLLVLSLDCPAEFPLCIRCNKRIEEWAA